MLLPLNAVWLVIFSETLAYYWLNSLISAGLGRKLKVLNLAFNDITDACLVHLKGT